jgi:N-acetylglucosamine kinase-like BadF-type ATPase
LSITYFIGIDGGGTKTYGVIADETGKLLASTKRDSSNYLQVGIDKARENLVSIIEELCTSQEIDLLTFDYAVIGLAGAGRPEDRETIMKALTSTGLRVPQLEIVPDFITALAGGTFGEAGVIIISGTGSVVFGVDEDGNTKRAGGWGHILADEGAGYQFGKEATRAVMQAFDGRGAATKLTDKILKKLNLEAPDKLVKWSLSLKEQEKPEIASLSPLVFEAFNEGDPVAEKIIELGVSGIVEMVEATSKGLHLKEKEFKIVLAGGNFEHQPKLVELLRNKLKPVVPKATALLPKFHPVVGAVILAMKNQEMTISKEIVSNLESSWKNMGL